MVAGEASGDFLGAHLIAALRKRVSNLRFVGIGGPKMQAQGFDSWFSMEKLAVRGYVEVLRHFPEIFGIRRKLGRRLAAARPRLFIGIDAPDFNLALERRLKRAGIPAVHYVSPSLWAWRGGRMRSIAASVSKMLVLFPFEEPLYRAAGVPVAYVGHPLADAAPEPGVHFLVPLASRETRAIFEEAMRAAGAGDLPLTVLFGHARDAIAACDVALVASGTATLEAALARKPMVITYKMAESTYRIMTGMGHLPWIGLPNIIAGEFLVPEILQGDATPENLAQATLNSLNDPVVGRRLPGRLEQIRRLLRRDTAARATEAVLPWLQSA